ncbi:hypothetical protein [Nitratifractor sp.]
MTFLRTWLALMLGLLLAGCSGNIPMLGGSGGSKEIPLVQMDETLAQSFPVVRKTPFGTVTILRANVQPNEGEKRALVYVPFHLVSFEIPEGINGLAKFTADLRYDPASHRLYFSNLTPTGLSFGNNPLAEYVSAKAIQGIPKLIAGILATTPLYQMDSTFSAKKVREISAGKNTLQVTFD